MFSWRAKDYAQLALVPALAPAPMSGMPPSAQRQCTSSPNATPASPRAQELENTSIIPVPASSVRISDQTMLTLSAIDEAAIITAFATADTDGSGGLDFTELNDVLLSLNKNLTDDELRAIYRVCDPNGDGHVTMMEFLKVRIGGRTRPRRPSPHRTPGLGLGLDRPLSPSVERILRVSPDDMTSFGERLEEHRLYGGSGSKASSAAPIPPRTPLSPVPEAEPLSPVLKAALEASTALGAAEARAAAAEAAARRLEHERRDAHDCVALLCAVLIGMALVLLAVGGGGLYYLDAILPDPPPSMPPPLPPPLPPPPPPMPLLPPPPSPSPPPPPSPPPSSTPASPPRKPPPPSPPPPPRPPPSPPPPPRPPPSPPPPSRPPPTVSAMQIWVGRLFGVQPDHPPTRSEAIILLALIIVALLAWYDVCRRLAVLRLLRKSQLIHDTLDLHAEVTQTSAGFAVSVGSNLKSLH